MRWALPALLLVLSVAGYVLTTSTVRRDRDHAAAERAAVESVRTEAVLERARAYLVSLGGALAGEPAPSARRFAQLQGSAAGTGGLTRAPWGGRGAAGRRGGPGGPAGRGGGRARRGGGAGGLRAAPRCPDPAADAHGRPGARAARRVLPARHVRDRHGAAPRRRRVLLARARGAAPR